MVFRQLSIDEELAQWRAAIGVNLVSDESKYVTAVTLPADVGFCD